MPKTVFINAENVSQYNQAVFVWLKEDFKDCGEPSSHFWHNKAAISSSFDEGNAMVVVDNKDNVIGYMIWRRYDGGAEIDIIEVKEDYRRQGICSAMLSDFTNAYPDIAVITTNVLPQAEKAFARMGLESVIAGNNFKKSYKIVNPIVQPLDVLPEGRAIAIYSKSDLSDASEYVDYSKVRDNPKHYPIKYYPISLVGSEGKLSVPVVAPFHLDGYVGIYFNKNLIAEGKAKYLLTNRPARSGLLILDRISANTMPVVGGVKLLEGKEKDAFFSQEQPEEVDEKNEVEDEGSRKRTFSEARLTFFQQQDSPDSIEPEPKKRKLMETTDTHETLTKGNA